MEWCAVPGIRSVMALLALSRHGPGTMFRRRPVADCVKRTLPFSGHVQKLVNRRLEAIILGVALVGVAASGTFVREEGFSEFRSSGCSHVF